MARYIELDALLAEINKRITDAPINNIGAQRVWAYNDVKDIINTLEVKEVQEEPVSEELEEAIEQSFIYHENRGDDFRSDEQIETTYRYGFESGAKWKERQMMAKAKGGTVQKDYQIIMDDGTYIDLDPSMQLKPAFNVNVNDKVKVIVTKED